MSSEGKSDLHLEIAHILFIDVVGYSKLLVDEQTETLQLLNQIVRGTDAFRTAEEKGELIRLPTGDGMALVFLTKPEAPVQCAMEISKAIKSYPELHLRMGIHSGPVNQMSDVNDRSNVTGTGINMAQRVMDCGDAGHILLSRRVAEDLEQYRQWQPYLHDLGECEVKHGVRVHIFNLCTDEVGNRDVPAKLKPITQKRAGAAAVTSAGESARSKRGLIVATVLLGIALALGFGFWIASHWAAPKSTNISQKSIAVLPFANLSEDKANAYFAEGIQDEILTLLAKIGALKVISRTSTARYASSPQNLPEIAQQLGVANILEGSVQKAGEAVHINVQLISAATDAHLWAESYDRELKNIFGVEREVAETVAGELKVKLLPHETKELARVPTNNAQAYDLYLKGRYIDDQYRTAQANSNKPAVDLYRQAIALDPAFALAYAALARAETIMYALGEDRSPERLADAQANAEKSLALQPDLIEGHLVLGRILARKHQFAKALAEYEPLLASLPNDAELLIAIASVKRDMGEWQFELPATLRATELDPRNSDYLRRLGNTYTAMRRYAEAENAYVKAQALAPDDWIIRASRADMLICEGKLAEARQVVETGIDTKLSESALSIKYSTLQQIETLARNYPAALAAGAKIPNVGNRIPTAALPIGDIKRNTDLGFDALYQGNTDAAQQAFLAAKKGLEPQRAARDADPDFYNDMSLIEAGLQDREAAVQSAKKAVALSSPQGPYASAIYLLTLTQVYAHFGDAEEAVPVIEKLIGMPSAGDIITPALLRLDPIWDSIRHDPRFEKLVTSPAPK